MVCRWEGAVRTYRYTISIKLDGADKILKMSRNFTRSFTWSIYIFTHIVNLLEDWMIRQLQRALYIYRGTTLEDDVFKVILIKCLVYDMEDKEKPSKPSSCCLNLSSRKRTKSPLIKKHFKFSIATRCPLGINLAVLGAGLGLDLFGITTKIYMPLIHPKRPTSSPDV